MKKNIPFNARITERDQCNLKSFADKLGLSIAETFRQLIPTPDIVDALMEYHLAIGASHRSPFATWRECLERAMLDFMHMVSINLSAPMHPLQVTRQDPEGLARVFTAFCRARRGVPGYSFETVNADGVKYTLVNDGNYCRGEAVNAHEKGVSIVTGPKQP